MLNEFWNGFKYAIYSALFFTMFLSGLIGMIVSSTKSSIIGFSITFIFGGLLFIASCMLIGEKINKDGDDGEQ